MRAAGVLFLVLWGRPLLIAGQAASSSIAGFNGAVQAAALPERMELVAGAAPAPAPAVPAPTPALALVSTVVTEAASAPTPASPTPAAGAVPAAGPAHAETPEEAAEETAEGMSHDDGGSLDFKITSASGVTKGFTEAIGSNGSHESKSESEKEHEEAHGEGEKEEEEEEEEGNEAVTVTAAASLLGMTASIQMLFYLTNCKAVLVRVMTWKMVSAAMSIFAAVLVFNTTNVALTASGIKATMPGLKVLVVWILSQGMLYRVKDNFLDSASVAILWGHVTGFFAINCFAHIQEQHFSETPLQSLIVVLLALVCIIVLSWVTRFLRGAAAVADDGEIDEEEEHWMEQCQEYEDDVITMALGFLVSQVLRFVASGKLVGYEEEPVGGTYAQIFSMQFWGLLLGLALIISTILKHKVKAELHGEVVARVSSIVQNFFGMASAWTVLYGLRWQFIRTWAAQFGSVIPAKLLLALAVSMGSVTVIFMLDLIGRFTDDLDMRTLRAITAAVGLLVGLSWESTFSASIEELAMSKKIHRPILIKVVLSIALFIIVFPSWQWYILPRTDKKLEKYNRQVVKDEEDDELEKALQESEDSGEENESFGSGDGEASMLKR